MNQLKAFEKGCPGVRISFCDSNAGVAVAFAEAFADVGSVEVLEGNLLKLNCDAVVSPANSFGDMSGGIDKCIDDFHDGQAQDEVMRLIRECYCGEIPVGAAIVATLPVRRFRFVIAAPTMRIPSNVDGTINAYLAMRAVLVAVQRHNQGADDPIGSVAIPGMCTGVGGMSSQVAAEQMRTAFDNITTGRWQDVVHPAMAPYAFRPKAV